MAHGALAGLADNDHAQYLLKPAGTHTGDFIRYNATSAAWEVAAEPLALQGLVLTPALAALVNVEGALYYNSANKAVMVCTDI